MQYVKIFGSTALTIFAFMFDRIYDAKYSLLAQFASRGTYAGVVWCALALFIFAFYCKSWKKHKHKGFQKIEAVFSLLFTVFILLGRSFAAYNNWSMLETQSLMAIFAGVGWYIFFYMLLLWLVYFINQQHIFVEEPKDQIRFQMIVFFVILICWLPQFILSLPGYVPSDGMGQLSQWFGYRTPSNHHPWFMTVLFGVLMSIGRGISDNAGIMLIIVFQVVFCAGAYSYVCMKVNKYAGEKAAYLTAIFFSIVPMWGVYAATVLKDTLFFAVFSLYFCSFIYIFESDGSVSIKTWVSFLLLSLLVCLIRHDGFYRVIPAGIILFFVLHQGRKQLLFVLTGICAVIFLYNTLIFNVIGIKKTSVAEMLAIPFQQTARYVRDWGNDISKEEKKAIDKILPYGRLAQSYKVDISDPVKNQMKKFKKKDFIEYIRVWFKMGKRHPGAYIQATINNTYGYYYPFRISRANGVYLFQIKEGEISKGFNIFYVSNPKIREALQKYDELWLVAPGISLLSNPGAYTWIVILGIMLLYKRKKYRQFAVFSVLIMQIIICMASPVNGNLRYAMPLMACTPLLLAWLAHILCYEADRK